MYLPHEGLAKAHADELGRDAATPSPRRGGGARLQPGERWLLLRARLTPGAAGARARLRTAEHWFYRDHGSVARVIPQAFFLRPRVDHALTTWAARGRALDPRLMEREWRRAAPGGHAASFHSALADYLSLVRDVAGGTTMPSMESSRRFTSKPPE